MKKLLSLFLVLATLLSLAGCGPWQLFQPEQNQQLSTQPSWNVTVPEETEEPTLEQTQETLEPQQDKDTRPREDEDTRPREDEYPTVTTPPVTVPTEPATQPTQPAPTTEPTTEPTQPETEQSFPNGLDPNGSYDSAKDVALFIVTYGRLPNNYITKARAKSYGWSSGSLERYAPGKCIGGDRFYNKEGLLPRQYTYYECDIGTLGSYSGRGSKRLVFIYSGLVYYTTDHYESFTLLYGVP